jgi:hypothetical protein
VPPQAEAVGRRAGALEEEEDERRSSRRKDEIFKNQHNARPAKQHNKKHKPQSAGAQGEGDKGAGHEEVQAIRRVQPQRKRKTRSRVEDATSELSNRASAQAAEEEAVVPGDVTERPAPVSRSVSGLQSQRYLLAHDARDTPQRSLRRYVDGKGHEANPYARWTTPRAVVASTRQR